MSPPEVSCSPMPANSDLLPVPGLVSGLSAWFRQASIRQKIGFGYALAISVTIVGTSVGRYIGDYYYARQAQQRLTQIQQVSDLLQQLQVTLLEARTHEQQLALLLPNSTAFVQERDLLGENVQASERYLRAVSGQVVVLRQPQLQQFVLTGEQVLRRYFADVQGLLSPASGQSLPPPERSAFQAKLVQFSTSREAEQVEAFSEGIRNFTQELSQVELKARQELTQAELLGTQITLGTMALSVALSVLLVLYTSRAIAYPLEAATQAARHITEASDFSLQVPVLSQDEGGTLAIALNSLIQRVASYTQELETIRESLEHRVEERTEELWRKNEQLEDAHDYLQQLNTDLVGQTQDLNSALQQLRATQAQLIQTEKMSSLGQMVAGVAHEINNPVNFIHGNFAHINQYVQDLLGLVNLYQQHYPLPASQIEERLEEIDFDFLIKDLPKTLASMKLGAERIRQIVVSLRNFSRLDEAETKAVNVHEGLDSTLLLLNHRIKHGIEIVKQYGNLPLVPCYPAQLNQVFMNILSNAMDALLSRPELTPKQIVIQTELEGDRSVCIRIRDNGPGIPPEARKKLFDPFFTTKPVGQGTGLGLAISYQIIEKHQGKIEVTSQVGEGAEFTIWLPHHTPVSALPPKAEAAMEQIFPAEVPLTPKDP